MAEQQAKVVVLGTNYYNGLSTLRCLGRANLDVVAAEYDKSSYGLKSRYAKEKLYLSDFKIDPQQTIKELIEYAKKQATKPVIIPTHDNYLLLLDDYQKELRPYYLMSLPEAGLARQVVEKDHLYALAKQNGVAYPETADLDSSDYLEQAEKIGYPILVKPIDSPAFTAKFRKKGFVCQNASELKEAKAQVIAAKIPCFMQKIIVGDDEHMLLFDAFVQQNGEIKHIFTGSKLRQWPINFGASCLMQQRYIEELVAVSTNFLKAIKWRGFAEIEFKKDSRDGKIYLIEINARITNFNACIAACGINIPLLTYQDLVNQALTPPALVLDYDTHIGFKYAYENYLAKRAYYKSGQWDKAHLRQQTKGKKFVSAIFDWQDPLPAWQFVKNKVAKKLK